MPGVTVLFSVDPSDGSLSSTSAPTNANGEATVVLTLGGTVGTYRVTASITGLPSVTFTASAVDTTPPPSSDKVQWVINIFNAADWMDEDKENELKNPVLLHTDPGGGSGFKLSEYCDFVELTLTIRKEDDTTEELTRRIEKDGTTDDPEILSTYQGEKVGLLGSNRPNDGNRRGFQIILEVDSNVEKIIVTHCGTDYEMPNSGISRIE